jgi:hypothetical protein
VTEPRDGAPDDELETEPLGDETDDDLGDESEALDDEALEPDLIDESEADVDAEVDDYDAAVRAVAGDEEVVPAPVVPRAERDARRRGQAPATRTPSPSEIAVHVREDWSKAFVILTVAVFTLILLNGIVLGHGGLLTPIPTDTPIPTESPSESPSASPSGSAAPSESIAPSASASPAATASSSAAPSTSASPSP